MYKLFLIALGLGCILNVVHSTPLLKGFAAERSKEIVEQSKEIVEQSPEVLSTKLTLGRSELFSPQHSGAPQHAIDGMVRPETWHIAHESSAHQYPSSFERGDSRIAETPTFESWPSSHEIGVYRPAGAPRHGGDGVVPPIPVRQWQMSQDTSVHPSSSSAQSVFSHSPMSAFRGYAQTFRSPVYMPVAQSSVSTVHPEFVAQEPNIHMSQSPPSKPSADLERSRPSTSRIREHDGSTRPAMESSAAAPSRSTSILGSYVRTSDAQRLEGILTVDPSIMLKPVSARRGWMELPKVMTYIKSPWLANTYERLAAESTDRRRMYDHSEIELSDHVLESFSFQTNYFSKRGSAYLLHLDANGVDGAPADSITLLARYHSKKIIGGEYLFKVVSFWGTVDNGAQLALLGVFRASQRGFERILKDSNAVKYSFESGYLDPFSTDLYLVPEDQ